MHAPIFHVVLCWQLGLAALLVIHMVRARRIVDRVVALDALALVVVAALGAVAIGRGEPGYLDVALALALLGFGQTVATARFLERRRQAE